MKDLSGLRFGRLTVKHRRTVWVCRCDCGAEKSFRPHSLTSGDALSCGCLTSARSGPSNSRFKHGWSHSRTAQSWYNMKYRCYDPKHERFADYGGRGITVCDRWRNSFENFLADMGERPPRTSLDRREVDGNYEPGNCRWATPAEQRQNQRPRPKRKIISKKETGKIS